MTNKTETKKNYWAVFQDNAILYEGSRAECWKWLVDNYWSYTMAALHRANIKIGRIN